MVFCNNRPRDVRTLTALEPTVDMILSQKHTNITKFNGTGKGHMFDITMKKSIKV